jgi:hypothetical protein
MTAKFAKFHSYLSPSILTKLFIVFFFRIVKAFFLRREKLSFVASQTCMSDSAALRTREEFIA